MTFHSDDHSLADQFAAAQDWWREAGVDCLFVDEAQALLDAASETAARGESAAARPGAAPPAAAQPARKLLERVDLPTDLALFRQWWGDPANPIPTAPGPRIPPRGPKGAPLMLVVPCPETEDRDALLQGSEGRLLGNILKALGLSPEEAYFASALPSHTTLPDWSALADAGLGEVLAHHVALAEPARVLFFGRELTGLFGHGEARPEALSSIEGVPTLTTFAPELLLGARQQRAQLWQRLLEWTKPA